MRTRLGRLPKDFQMKVQKSANILGISFAEAFKIYDDTLRQFMRENYIKRRGRKKNNGFR